jgi:hypothetical protein
MKPDQTITVDVPKPLPKLTCGKTHCDDAISTYPAKDLRFLDQHGVVNVPELEGRTNVLKKQISIA